MVEVLIALEEDGTSGVVLEDLLDGGTVMVMEGCALPDTYVLTPFLVKLIDPGLEDDGDTLHEEDTAEEGH